ncbi:1648_t:CDS:2 [Scutellospora calospora]|uniref:1648_t:CDS:1 n=1 Tax=Scutellospora calospora TaxID=85575 RepID=A0ACA9LGL6_9GLOM|nr:1648_t:CDS:2 [Scutellospora calospora]
MKKNSRAYGDIFTIKNILDAAGVDLNNISDAPSANQTAGETIRSAGIVIVIVIEYKNVPFKKASIVLLTIHLPL